MRIDNVKLDMPVIFAPMAGISDLVYRRIARSMGAGMTVTEMVSAKAIMHGNAATRQLLRTDGHDRPSAVQIFGSCPDAMGAAAAFLDESPFEIIDINSGCPSPKIVKNGDGAALMRTPKLAQKIIQAIKKNTTKPVTIKIRLGWDHSSINCVEYAKMAEAEGVAAITIHGRTRNMMFGGHACWDGIKSVRDAVRSIPVIGNGDINDPYQAKRLMEQSGVDAVMIGRAAYGDPWVFKRIADYLRGGILHPMPTMQEKIDMALHHVQAAIDHDGEKVALREMRKHIAWYIKGLKNATPAKVAINNSKNFDEVKEILRRLEYED